MAFPAAQTSRTWPTSLTLTSQPQWSPTYIVSAGKNKCDLNLRHYLLCLGCNFRRNSTLNHDYGSNLMAVNKNVKCYYFPCNMASVKSMYYNHYIMYYNHFMNRIVTCQQIIHFKLDNRPESTPLLSGGQKQLHYRCTNKQTNVHTTWAIT